jgi:2-hydroxychromene-2-carboxylate isomerase
VAKATDRLAKSTVPRLVASASTVRGPAKAGAAIRRARGGRGRVELFFAFDDPASALALVELDRRLSGRNVDLVAIAVADNAMEGDPAVDAKRAYAVIDTARLARRNDLRLARKSVLAPADVRQAMEWAATAGTGPGVTDFCVQAARSIWFETEGTIDSELLAGLWLSSVRTEPPVIDGGGGLAANAKRMRRRGAYGVPMAWVHGRLYFAHERLDQICEELDRLGWKEQS